MKSTLAVLAVAASLAACRSADLKPVRDGVPNVSPFPAPDFTLQDLSSGTFRLSDLRGKTVLLDFWATWCAPCKQSIPRYMKMQKRLGAKGFVVVGVDEGEAPEIVSAYVKAHGMNYRVLLDPHAGLFRDYGARGLPAVFLIDAQGNVRGKWEGFDAATGVDVERATDVLLGSRRRL